MSDELRLPDDLAACEARLAAQSLPASTINRDELMYRAGWAAGVEATRLAAANSPPLKVRARGGVRIAVASLTSAAAAASLAVWVTLAWQGPDVAQVAGVAPRPDAEARSIVEASQPSSINLIAAEPMPLEMRIRPSIDVGLLGLRTRALNQASLLSQSSTASNGDLPAPSAKTARQLLDEMLPAAGERTPSWLWEKNFAGDSI